MSALGEWVEEGIDLLTSRLPITIIAKKAMNEREREAYELGRACGPVRSQPGRPKPPPSRPRHLHAV